MARARLSSISDPALQFLHAARAAAMMNEQSLRAGDLVFTRRQRWRVVSIRPYPACKVVALAGASRTNAGQTAHVVTPFDDIEPAVRPRAVRLVSTRRWRRRCRELIASHGPADRLQTAEGAQIDLLPHQLEPALAIVRGLACRVLIADEVGLGKTIQAGLIAAELKARGMADRILVLTPSGLREQWADELKRRFKLNPVVMDAPGIRRRSTSLAVGVNPWATVPIAIASLDYVKRPEVQPALISCRWDLVIVDEAHGAGPGSDRLGAVRAICGRTSYVALLTATPHSGSRNAFDALCRIGDQAGDRLLIFRRRRDQVALSGGRRVHRVLVATNPAEREMHAAVADLAAAVAADPESARDDAWLAVAVLQKRAFSCAHALAQTVGRRLAAMHPGDPDAGQQLLLPLADAGELDPSDEAPQLSPVLRNASSECRLLKIVAARAVAAGARETKLVLLERLLGRFARLREQAIVFTEYRDTLLHVRGHLSCDCAVLHGGMTREERRVELERFASGRCRVLLATDAAGEGLNLHERCRAVINLELPWNPTRLEQRIGRVDRIGQKRRVHAFHLISSGTGEMRILDHLRAKLMRARADISAADPLGDTDCDDQDATLVEIAAGLERTNRLSSNVSHLPAEQPEFAAFGRLEPEAAMELQRLVTARRFSAGARPSDLDTDDCLAVATRRRQLRAQLNGRSLAIVCAAITDEFGRLIARSVMPALATVQPCGAPHRLKQHLSALAEAIEIHAARIDDGRWYREATTTHAAFVDARRRRDARILADLERRRPFPAQAGLFDRRALREVSDEAANFADLKNDLEQSIARASTPTCDVLRVALLMAGRW
jgi:superfamily II DNA or RNA helicase